MKTRARASRGLIAIGGLTGIGLSRAVRRGIGICGSTRALVEQLATARNAIWVCLDRSLLADALHEWLRLPHQRHRRLGRLLLLDGRSRSSPVLRGLFHVVGDAPAFRTLPRDQLFEALLAPSEQARELLVGGVADRNMQALSLVRGDLSEILVPFSFFEPAGGIQPDFRRLGFTDHGQTVRLGAYEAASDAILYGVDAAFRRRLNARRRAGERGFGPSLRRLRKQLGIKRTGFPGVDAKTIARIERGEIREPRKRTLDAIGTRLDMSVKEIESY